ncbi:GGDEF domain-containing protein, partial [Acinetobacter baumannii]
LDRFKPVNDTWGHLAGDAVLWAVASVLRHGVRDSDVVARLGGDEFAVILSGCTPRRAARIGGELLQT